MSGAAKCCGIFLAMMVGNGRECGRGNVTAMRISETAETAGRDDESRRRRQIVPKSRFNQAGWQQSLMPGTAWPDSGSFRSDTVRSASVRQNH